MPSKKGGDLRHDDDNFGMLKVLENLLMKPCYAKWVSIP